MNAVLTNDFFTPSPSAWVASFSLLHNHCFPCLLHFEVCQLTDSIKSCTPFNPVDHDLNVLQVRQEQIIVRKDHDNNLFNSIIGHFNLKHQRAILRSKNTLSSWLTALPVQRDNFNHSAHKFSDTICL